MNQPKLNDSDRIKVIWMDDDPSAIFKNYFFHYGIDTKTCASAEEALTEYKTQRGTYQAVILDMECADGTVDEFSIAVKEFEPLLKKDNVPFYILTGYTENDLPYKLAKGTITSFGINKNLFYSKSHALKPLTVKIINDVVYESERFRLYKKYESAFEAFEKDILDKNFQGILFNIVESFSGKSDDFHGLFNEMRQMYEMILHRFVHKKFPSGYFYGLKSNGQPSFSNEPPMETRKNVISYLKGEMITVGKKESRLSISIHIQEERIMSKFMADNLEKLYHTLNDNSHSNSNNWASNPGLRAEMPHFLESNALLFIDFIIWAKNTLLDDNKRFQEIPIWN